MILDIKSMYLHGTPAEIYTYFKLHESKNDKSPLEVVAEATALVNRLNSMVTPEKVDEKDRNI